MENQSLYGAPFNREVGRLFLDRHISVLALLNPCLDLRTGKIKKPLVVDLHKKHGGLDVLNIACGGCSDIPLLDK